MTTKTSNDELAGAMTQRLLRLAAATALIGGSVRLGASVLRNANPRYEPPEVPKPTIVDMPYPVPAPPPMKAIPPTGKEKKAPPTKAANTQYPDWAKNLGLFGRTVHDLAPAYTPPTGNPGATDPNQVPLFGAGQVLATVGGGAGGYMLTDKILRAADRWRARRDLDAARREYQDSITRRLSGTDLASKSAATDAPAGAAVETKVAIDALYAVLTQKRAQAPAIPSPAGTPNPNPDPASRTVASLLWPGLWMGPDAARINAMIAAGAGGLGGYMGYNWSRDDGARANVRKQIRAVDRANADKIPAPLIARLVPVPQST